MATIIDPSPPTTDQTTAPNSAPDAEETHPRMFVATITSIPPAMSDLLSNYSSIPPTEQITHIINVRNKAYTNHPYPCLGRFRFIDLDLSAHPLYQTTILPFLRRSPDTFTPPHAPIFLDLGTCLGQDLRKLIHDGIGPSRVYGSDILPGFIDAGYALFRDEHKFARDDHFLVPGNVFDDSDASALARLDGKVDVANVTAVFHLFDLSEQIKVAHRVLKLMRKDPGQKVLIVGAQAGKVVAEASVRDTGSRKFRHNVESWREMWNGVFASEEWRGKVANYQVESELQEGRIPGNQGRQLGPGGTQVSDRVLGDFFKGFRWHVFWIWVEFK